MAPLSLYDLSIPIMARSLRNLSTLLKIASEHCTTKNIPADSLITARLSPDMLPLPFQIQSACDSAKGVAVRLGGHAPVVMADTESSFEELQARIARTLDVLGAVERSAFEGKEGVDVEIRTAGGEFVMTGLQYLQEFALPNFYFHVVTAYGVMRSQGVPLGKTDYLAGLVRR